LTFGTRAVGGDDADPRCGDVLERPETGAEAADLRRRVGREIALSQRKAKPSAIGAGRPEADGGVEQR